MKKELSYISPEGNTVFTSQYLKNKGTCCKSACLHCPYGFTLKKHGLEFKDFSEADTGLLEEVISESGQDSNWQSFTPENIKFILIKGSVCGVMLKNHIIVKHVYLKPHFQDQGLSKELIESYYFI